MAAKALLNLESPYPDPPVSDHDRFAVVGLRGGAAVLMVAVLEDFLGKLLPECLAEWEGRSRKVRFQALPEAMQIQAVWATLEAALDGPRFGPTGNKPSRLPQVLAAAGIVYAQRINPGAFATTGGNPNAERVAELFRSVGVPDVFRVLKADFEVKWGGRVAHSFIRDTLESIVERRHQVAHTGAALAISRKDLADAVRFMETLGPCLDLRARRHLNGLYRSAR